MSQPTRSSSNFPAEASKLSQNGISEFRVSAEERSILESRMADLEENPSAQESWQEARTSLESRRR
jgi:hypothetical protein